MRPSEVGASQRLPEKQKAQVEPGVGQALGSLFVLGLLWILLGPARVSRFFCGVFAYISLCVCLPQVGLFEISVLGDNMDCCFFGLQ